MEFSQQINPEWFDPKRIDPEMQELNRQLEQQSRDNPARWEMALEVERGRTPGNGILQPSAIADGVTAENFHIDGPGGKLLIRKLTATSGTAPAAFICITTAAACAWDRPTARTACSAISCSTPMSWC